MAGELTFTSLAGTATRADGGVVAFRRGDVVDPSDLAPGELDRLRALLAISDGAAPDEDANPVDIRTLTVAEISEWIATERPKVSDLVDLVGDDGVLARKVLEAESAASGQDPRKSLVSALEAVIGKEG